ncbi:DUF3667 domain-containing protein [Hymenobacter koreensis]|uniref:DUF3667 domain-containing protein n=1 Tax=Hymenobacter koreensis TaxID=1084523 RepID=A0ABP8J402_9BACT
MESTLAHSPVTDSAPVDHAAHHACLNCSAPLTDQFCARCGQSAATHRFTLRHLLFHDLPHSVWHVDKGLLYTLPRMVTQPGATISEYLAGRRARHFHPFTYLLILVGVSALALSAVQLNPYTTTPDLPRLLVLTMERYMASLIKYPAAMYVLLLPLNAIVALWLLRPTRYNYAEMLISQAFIIGTLVILTLGVMIPLLLLLGKTAHFQPASLLMLLLSLLYPAWVYAQLLGSTGISATGKWVRALGTSLLQMVVMLLSCILFMVYIGVSLARQDPSLLDEFKAKSAPKQTTAQPAPQR